MAKKAKAAQAEPVAECVHDLAPAISPRDADLGRIFSQAFQNRFEIHSYRNAARILQSANKAEFEELVAALAGFEIDMPDILEKGGNKSKVAEKMDNLLNPLGWLESRIVGTLMIEVRKAVPNPKYNPVTKRGRKFDPVAETMKIENFIDGHKIDFVKGRMAFDLEWNSKDQTFDRDLYAMRAFYECGIINAGILLTRSTDMARAFADIGSRLATKEKFKDKYGASTTWMGKLTYRLNAGRAGGCPILALGIKPSVLTSLEAWKRKNPIRGKVIDPATLIPSNED